MKLSELKLPENGSQKYVYAVYRKKIVFGLYDKAVLPDADLLEIHIFDENSEYRAAERMGKRTETADITDDTFKGCKIIEDRMMLYGKSFVSQENGIMTVSENDREFLFFLPYTMTDFNKGIYLKVKNYYSFDENDLIYLKGYRMCGLEIGGEK